jgi:predicted nuclease of predicted toxin-antitoxin system
MFLANENFPKPSIILLRNHGFNIKSIQEELPGISDEEVISIAIKENLIILTFDRDYGELIFKHSKDKPPSVIYFRTKGNNPGFAGKFLIDLISNFDISIENAFTVVEEKNIRQRFYKK